MEKNTSDFKKRYDAIFKVLQESSGSKEIQLIDGGEHADLSSTQAFIVAKEKKIPPAQWAKDFVVHYSQKICDVAASTVKASGPYLNFYFDNSYISNVLM